VWISFIFTPQSHIDDHRGICLTMNKQQQQQHNRSHSNLTPTHTDTYPYTPSQRPHTPNHGCNPHRLKPITFDPSIPIDRMSISFILLSCLVHLIECGMASGVEWSRSGCVCCSVNSRIIMSPMMFNNICYSLGTLIPLTNDFTTPRSLRTNRTNHSNPQTQISPAKSISISDIQSTHQHFLFIRIIIFMDWIAFVGFDIVGFGGESLPVFESFLGLISNSRFDRSLSFPFFSFLSPSFSLFLCCFKSIPSL